MPSADRHIFCICHRDLWGILNANQLVRGLAAKGFKPVLILSSSTPGEDGKPASKNIPSLLPTREAKENCLHGMFDLLDKTAPLYRSSEKNKPRYLTPAALAAQYCLDGTYYQTDRGGFKGGDQVAAIFRELEQRGIVPEIVLSGDTLAILPAEIVERYDCFGTHPGPLFPGEELPVIQGMQGTARSVIYNAFFDQNGRHVARPNPMGLNYVKGSFFNLRKELDEGPVIAEGLAPYVHGMCLFQVRVELYHSLIQIMLDHVDQLMVESKRKSLIQQKKSAQHAVTSKGAIKPELSEDFLIDWLLDGAMYRREQEYPALVGIPGDEERMELASNQIMSASFFKNCIAGFLPEDTAKSAINYIYETYFRGVMARVPKTIFECPCDENLPGVKDGILTVYPSDCDPAQFESYEVLQQKTRDFSDGFWQRTSLVLPTGPKPRARMHPIHPHIIAANRHTPLREKC